MNLMFHKMWGIPRLAQNRLASKEGLCSTESISKPLNSISVILWNLPSWINITTLCMLHTFRCTGTLLHIMHVAYLPLYQYAVTHFTLLLMKHLFLIICKQCEHAVHNRVLLLFDTCLCALCVSQFLVYPAFRVLKYKTPVLGSSWNANNRITEG
jgi:hypothetical protein